MKYFFVVVLLALTGCATLPAPVEGGNAQFVVAAFAENETSVVDYSFRYQLKLEHQQSGETRLVEIRPSSTRVSHLTMDLTPGDYCIVGYYSLPAFRSGHSYNYKPSLKEFNDCFTLPENRMSVWSLKFVIRKYESETVAGRIHQNFRIVPRTVEDREAIEKSLQRFKTFELWQPLNWLN